ncbi:low-specificity L-threonine aldolase [Proteinivorax hydrogeniformans]|uniref:Low-specificity L-threonine aldolase n=1 Tax=Proteinivorax hydrogeniformans TaxID=1826727 RepID=A0AAU8HVV3_9FIRM
MIELRSDTFTVANHKMREVMAQAKVGDDVYGEDPTVNELQAQVAKLFGKERSLFVPTGTMGNLLAVLSVCDRGDEIITEYNMHMFKYEVANISAIASVQINPISGVDGKIPLDYLKSAIREENIHFPQTKMIALENTHNMAGGKVLEKSYIDAVGKLAKDKGLHLHIDGARIFNAQVSLGIEMDSLVENADSIMVCLSKGLGAPVGSMLVGKNDFIEKALKYRKMLGGGMRQWGHCAAAGLYALENGPKNLKKDHEHCEMIGKALAEKDWVESVDSSTNICRFTVSETISDKLVEYMEKNLIKIQRTGSFFRIVTHLNVSKKDVEKVLDAINQFKPGN